MLQTTETGWLPRIRRMAEKLTTIPNCPRTEGAVQAIAEDVAEICNDWDEAEWLVREARSKWEDWKGRRGLLQLLDNRRWPQLPPSNLAQDLGPKPEVTCRLCEDWGHIEIIDGITGKSRRDWCRCEVGKGLQKSLPGYIYMLNSKGASRQTKNRRISQAELDEAFDGRQNAIEKLIAQEQAILENPDTTKERREVAHETLKSLGAETEVSA